MSTSPELKACPFCNHAAYLATWTERIEIGWDSGLGSPSPMFNTHHEVRCGDKEKFHNAGCGAKVRGDSEAEAIANWNRRASLSERDAALNAKQDVADSEKLLYEMYDRYCTDSVEQMQFREAVADFADAVSACEKSGAGDAATAVDTERLNALEAREYQIECMGTSVPYFNVWAKNGDLFTTADTRQKLTLRQAIDKACAKSEAPRTP